MQNYYDWSRFWVQRGAKVDLIDGFFHEPYSFVQQKSPLEVAKLEDLVIKIPCLVLLGEPGMGKTTELKREKRKIEDQIRAQGDEIIYFDLRDFQDASYLFNSLQNDPVLKNWLNATNKLHLFFDSLDEALININTLSTALIRELSKLPVERLMFRVACRTSEWPSVLEAGLMDLWNADGKSGIVACYGLAPLRQDDVKNSATVEGIDSVAFLNDVVSHGAGVFASKPVTLSFLMKIYKDNGTLPKRKSDLYHQGCWYLCKETNKERLQSKRAGNLLVDQCLVVAGRIAAVTLLSNHSGVRTDFDINDVYDGFLLKEEFVGGVEIAKGQKFNVTISEIAETLNTGLLSIRGAGRLGWAHLTYAEYLAAWYLLEHKLDIYRILNLIFDSSSVVPGVIPQLGGLAAWLASLSPAIFQEMAKTDPKALLGSDLAGYKVEDREYLIGALLHQFDTGQIHNFDWGNRQILEKLDHPALGEQLRPYITDISRKFEARHFAIELAELCEVRALQDNLVGVALNSAEHITLRVDAAYAVVSICDIATRAKLKPLIYADTDPNDELKG